MKKEKKTYKYSPAVRAVLSQVRREQRAAKKIEKANLLVVGRRQVEN